MTAHSSWDHLSTAEQTRQRAEVLAEAHTDMLSELVQLPIGPGMKQTDVAEILGTTQQSVSKVESYDANPRLGTLQAYANAIGTVVELKVRRDDAIAQQDPDRPSEPSGRLPSLRDYR